MMAKRNPEQVLDAIDAWDEEDAIDAEMERVLALSPGERESELLASGVDVEAERAKARVWREKAAGGAPATAEEEPRPGKASMAASPNAAPPPKAAPPRGTATKSRGWWWSRGGMIAAAAALAAAVLVVLTRPDHPPDWVSSPYPGDASPTLRDRAEALRQKAYAACDTKAWAECSALLDEAKGLDPAGETDPGVKILREAIRDAKRP